MTVRDRPRSAPSPAAAAAWAGEPLFVYGSLSLPEVLRAVLGRDARTTPAAVTGWRAAALTDRVFPGLVPARDRRVDGLLVEGLDAAQWRLVDEFEARWYDLRGVALLGGGEAWTYVLGAGAPVEAGPHDWDRDVFATHHLTGYLERCAAWRARRARRAQ